MFKTVRIKDAAGNVLTTPRNNVFVVVNGTRCLVNMPPDNGVKNPVLVNFNFRLMTRAPEGVVVEHDGSFVLLSAPRLDLLDVLVSSVRRKAMQCSDGLSLTGRCLSGTAS